MLVASGMIVGESLFGVLNAGLIVAFNKRCASGGGRSLLSRRLRVAIAGFAGLIVLLYGWLCARARSAA